MKRNYYNNNDSRIFGLKPTDLYPEQIKKLADKTLLDHIDNDERFLFEFIDRTKTLSKVYDVIGTGQINRNYAEDKRFFEHINNLAQKETDFSLIDDFYEVLTNDNKKLAANFYIAECLKAINFGDKLKNKLNLYLSHIDKNSHFLIDLFFLAKTDLRQENTKRFLVNLLSIMSKELIEKLAPELELLPDGVQSQLLNASYFIPNKLHIMSLRAIGRLTHPHFYVKMIRTKINPAVVKKLNGNYRINAMLSMFAYDYPFTHKITKEKLEELLFPAMFKENNSINQIKRITEFYNYWERKDALKDLPEYEDNNE